MTFGAEHPFHADLLEGIYLAAADVMAERAEQQIPVPDEGDLGSDLRARPA